jgi:hypothetical protein
LKPVAGKDCEFETVDYAILIVVSIGIIDDSGGPAFSTGGIFPKVISSKETCSAFCS